MSIPGTLEATNRIAPALRKIMIDGIIASRRLSPVSTAACRNRSSSSVR